MNEDLLSLWVNGEPVTAATPVISAEDPAFLFGLAVFETLLWEDRCLYFVSDHLKRLERGARELGIGWPPPWDLEAVLDSFTEPLPAEPLAVRLTLTPGAPGQGPTLVIAARPAVRPPAEGISVIVIERAKMAGSSLENLKATSRVRNIMARAEAQRRGAWEAILGTDAGDLAEGSVSNLFVVRGGELLTPALDRGCLPGIVREKILGELAARGEPGTEGRVEPDDLLHADEVFLTGSVSRIQPVKAILGMREDLPGVAGPRTRRIAELLRELEERYRASSRGDPAASFTDPGAGSR